MAEPQQPWANTQQPPTQQPVVPDQQMTSKTPATKQKNPKRVAAGKAVAEKTRIAREAQKKALIEAQSIIAQAKPAEPADPPPSVAQPPSVVDPPSVTDPPSTKNVLTTTQWLSIISIVVSLAGIYYKREEIKKVFAKKDAPPPTPTPSPVNVAPTTIMNRMD